MNVKANRAAFSQCLSQHALPLWVAGAGKDEQKSRILLTDSPYLMLGKKPQNSLRTQARGFSFGLASPPFIGNLDQTAPATKKRFGPVRINPLTSGRKAPERTRPIHVGPNAHQLPGQGHEGHQRKEVESETEIHDESSEKIGLLLKIAGFTKMSERDCSWK